MITDLKPSDAIGYVRDQLDAQRWKLVERVVELTLLQLAVLSRETWPEAARIGLATTDQDMNGGQLVVCVKDAFGNFLGGGPNEGADEFQDIYTYNLDDDTRDQWAKFVDLQYGLEVDDKDAERYLHVEKILKELG